MFSIRDYVTEIPVFLCRYLDYISIMSYDYFGPWSSVLGHNSPLYVPSLDRQSASASLMSQVLLVD